MPPRRRLRSDRRVFLLSLAAALPGALAALALAWSFELAPGLRWLITLAVPGLALVAAAAAATSFRRPAQTLSNLLAALRVGDYSIRSRHADPGDPLGLALNEANALSDRLRAARLGGMEAEALLRAVLEEIDVAIIAVDAEERIQFLNRSAEVLLGRPLEEIQETAASEVGIRELLHVETPATIVRTFPGRSGRWDVRVSGFRQDGRPHRLLVLADVSRALRQEEREAWQKLIRVLSHEINNSLTPIKSISRSLLDLLGHEGRDAGDGGENADVADGLEVIAKRAEGLARFMTSYARLARLPPPTLQAVRLEPLVQRVARLEEGRVVVRPGPDLILRADPDQLDQLLINLIRNGIEAAGPNAASVEVGWESTNGEAIVWVRDEGPGVASTDNLFVPFFTTKAGGSGIGLVLSRQIAEAHGGTVTLRNRDDARGAEARLTLPLRRR
jgi:two-component system, NtrC family, nitrogen regulation sensor histidine kinase NtrY